MNHWVKKLTLSLFHSALTKVLVVIKVSPYVISAVGVLI
jgi:hypothetical protein